MAMRSRTKTQQGVSGFAFIMVILAGALVGASLPTDLAGAGQVAESCFGGPFAPKHSASSRPAPTCMRAIADAASIRWIAEGVRQAASVPLFGVDRKVLLTADFVDSYDARNPQAAQATLARLKMEAQ